MDEANAKKQVVVDINKKLEEMPYDLLTDKGGLNLRPYQLNAIKAAEKATETIVPEVAVAAE
ncbi:MAG: hypothetical protein EGQ54_07025 [[Ruminococcus] lactaris]|nr:hypothetical protein [[Ruminococcus] lactaris]